MYALGTKPYNSLRKLGLKYGNIIGLDLAGFKGIILNDADTIRKAFTSPEFQNRPKYEFVSAIRGQNPTGIIFSYGKTHDEQRIFVQKNLKIFGLNKKTMEILLVKPLECLFEVLDGQLEKPVLNKDLFNTISIVALWTILSSESARADDEEFKTVLKLAKRMGSSFNMFMCFFPTLSKLFPNISGWNGMVVSNTPMIDFMKKKITMQKNVPTISENPKNFMHSYLQKIESTTDPNSTFFGDKGRENMVSTVLDLFGAGTETVSTTLTWFLAVLIRHPDKQEKMQEAIDRGIGTRIPTLEDRQLLPYVEAFVLELLRFSAVIPLGVPHALSKDVEFQNFLIPKDTIVIPNLHNVLRDPVLWSQPDVFKPERFLSKDESTILRNDEKTVDLVFGHGKRLCVGATLAKDELFLIIK